VGNSWRCTRGSMPPLHRGLATAFIKLCGITSSILAHGPLRFRCPRCGCCFPFFRRGRASSPPAYPQPLLPSFPRHVSLPRPNEPPAELPIIYVPESSDILQPFLQHLYPRSPPRVTDISMWAALYTIADKYGAEVVTDPLRDMLIPCFLETSPLRVYALASRWGFEEEAKTASRRTLTMDIFKDFPREDAELMGGVACQRLYLLHFNRREAARALIASHPPPSTEDRSCKCSPPQYVSLVLALCQHVAVKPWLTTEELYEEVARWGYPTQCSSACRNAIKNMHAYFSSILRGVSELPQTI
jgi:hypothetical protein